MLVFFLATALASTAPHGLPGRWINPSGSVTIRIAPCGPALCGTVTSASPKAKDDAARAGTPQLVGTKLLTDLASDGDGRWTGQLFVPDIPIRTDATVEQEGARRIKVSGCAAGGLLCKSQVWTRATR